MLSYWRNKDRIRHRCREYRLLNRINQEDWFEAMSRDRSTEMFLIIRQHEAARDKARIGVCGLTNINWKDRHAEVSIYIGDPQYKHRGVATWALGRLAEIAFMEYGLHRLWAEIYAFNKPSEDLFGKCGYKYEGTMRQTVWHDGQWWDSYILGLLGPEWKI